MKTAKIFQNGRSQEVRLPKEFRFNEDEVTIKAFGNGISQNYKKSIEYYKQAINNGNKDARFKLENMYKERRSRCS